MFNKIVNTFGTRLLSAIFNLLITIIISRFLGPEGKGEQGIIIATIAYILVFSNLMGGSAIVYLVPRFPTRVIIVPAYIWSVFSSILFFFILHFFKLVDPGMIIHICALSAISAFTAINSSVLIGREKITASNFISFLQPLIITLSLVIFFPVFNQNNIYSYVISLYISFGTTFIASLLLLRKFGEKFSFATLGNYRLIIAYLFRYGLLNQLAHIFQLLSFRMSYYWIEQTYSSAEVGIYSNGTSLVESIWLISRSISLVQYARIANTTDRIYSQKITLQLTYASLVISFLGLLVLTLLPPGVFSFIFGKGFNEISTVIRTLAPGVLFFNVALIIGHYFSGTGKYQVNTIASFAGLIVAIVAFNFLIPSYGIAGAGWGTSISYLVTTLIVIWFFVKESSVGMKESLPKPGEIRQLLKTLKISGSSKK